MFTNWKAALILLVTLSTGNRDPHSDSMKLRIYSGRPLAHAAKFIAEHYNVPVSFEECAYGTKQEVVQIVPGGALVVPKHMELNINIPLSSDVSTALDTIANATRNTLPFEYTTRTSAESAFGLLPVATRDPSDIPLDFDFAIGPFPLTTDGLLEQLAKQATTKFPDVEIHMGQSGPELDARPLVPNNLEALSARTILDRIVRSWSARTSRSGVSYTWQLRYSPADSREKKVFVLAFPRIVGEETHSNVFIAESPHPMSTVIQLMEDEYKTPVLFEESPAVCHCDLIGEPGTPRVGLAGDIVKLPWRDGDSIEHVLQNLIGEDRFGENRSRPELYELQIEGPVPVVKAVRIQTDAAVEDYAPILDEALGQDVQAGSLSIEELARLASSAAKRPIVPAPHAENGPRLISALTLEHALDADTSLRTLLSETAEVKSASVSVHLIYEPALMAHVLEARVLDIQ